MTPKNDCSTPGCCAGKLSRRETLRLMGLGAISNLLAKGAMAGPFDSADFDKLVPADKKLRPEWVKSLFERGAPEIYSGTDLEKIGMPVGGICTGQLYLGGDGKLWHWDIFNQHMPTGAEHYANPQRPNSPLEQGFALRVSVAGKSSIRNLDRTGFSGVTFRGEYPIGFVEYHDDACPVSVSLEAFSPFIPLNPDDSSLPATIFQFTLKNIGQEKAECELAGWLENAVCLHSGGAWHCTRQNKLIRNANASFLESSAVIPKEVSQKERPPIVFADFEGETYGEWKVEGDAFGNGPAKGAPAPEQRLMGFLGKALANSWAKSDGPVGKLTSPVFKIERDFISFLIGGGNHPGQTCINLIIDGKVARTQTGRDTDAMDWANWKVNDLIGKNAQIQIVDANSGGWGHIDIDQIEFRDTPRGPTGKIDDEPDFGTMGLALLNPEKDDSVTLSLPGGNLAEEIFPQPATETEAQRPHSEKLVGAIKRKLTIEPGKSATVHFVIAWHFPNLNVGPVHGSNGRHYAVRFDSASAVAAYVAQNFESLSGQTRLWHDTWYDSTLPYWFLDRTFLNTSILATSTSFRFKDGRFWGWEGVGCCEGTCTHVWHYAHAAARLFPQLERDLRERTDLGLAFDARNGVIRFRGEGAGLAIDGQSGCVLRAYREHQISADDTFLKRIWPKIKMALECLIHQDGGVNGLLQGSQHNTLDTNWFGPVAWLTSLYLAALRAGEEMARDVADDTFAKECHEIWEKGSKAMVEQLFEGDYFINKPDTKHLDAINSGSGCHIDQVFGQSWAWQVGLGRVLPQKETLKALQSLWRFNFSPDVGPYRAVNKPGRWYAMPGEAGLLMCTFPRTDWDYKKASGKGPEWAAGYFNECMNGFEYQVAWHMVAEGMLTEGFAVTRAVHDRYHPSRRNPWNEVECGDHYARSMASYGVFLAACGFEYHGPKGTLGFFPRITPENFRAPFTVAEGWGTFMQNRDGNTQRATVDLKWGKFHLKTLAFAFPGKANKVTLKLDGAIIPAELEQTQERISIRLAADATLIAGKKLDVEIS